MSDDKDKNKMNVNKTLYQKKKKQGTKTLDAAKTKD